MQQGEADDLQELLFKELERTPQHGLQFARAMRSLMHHEDQWADWKADGAKSFERQKRPLASVPPPAKRRRVSQPASLNLGTRELSRCRRPPLHRHRSLACLTVEPLHGPWTPAGASICSSGF